MPSKRLWTIVHGLLYGLIQKMGYNGHKSHGPYVCGVNMPLAKSLSLQCCNGDGGSIFTIPIEGEVEPLFLF